MSQAPAPIADQPLRKSAQQLRWFVQNFEKQAHRTEAQTGNTFSVDREVLTQVFVEWLRSFEAQKPSQEAAKEAYVGFAAGLMLRNLVRRDPVAVTSLAPDADLDNPAYFWPEGYLYVAFCLNVRGRVLEQDFDITQTLSDTLSETRTWWSLRENVLEDPAIAIAFLDLFVGNEPQWSAPDVFRLKSSGRLEEGADRDHDIPKKR